MTKRKTILFFDRCNLTSLYILLGKELCNYFNVIHVAYSDIEANELERAGIRSYYHYINMFSRYIDNYTPNINVIEEIDNVIIEYSDGSFNLNSSIQSDRGYTLLSYEECIKSVQCHYLAWKEVFDNNKVDYFYHEPCSLFLNHIAAILCNKQGGIYRYLVQVKSDISEYSYLNVRGDKFTCPEMESRYAYYLNNPHKIQTTRCQDFLNSFRKDYSVFFGNVVNNKMSTVKLWRNALVEFLSNYKHRNDYDSIKMNIDYWLSHQNKYYDKLENLKQYKKKKIQFIDIIPSGERYYYYSMHLEPEAVVLYLGDGIYSNQIKLIENIAASIPPGFYLYVKDHPHEYAYRSADDYERLMRIPNIRLIHQSISGKALIANSVGVFTINGTAGFEGLMLNKQVYCFGQNYYSFMPKVNYIRNIRDARNIIYNNLHTTYSDDVCLYSYVNAFLDSAHKGFVNYFSGRANIFCKDQVENAKDIANDIIKEIDSDV